MRACNLSLWRPARLPLCLPLLLLAVAALSACAPATRVTLLPQASGHPSAVETITATAVHKISTPYEVVNVGQRGGISVGQTNEREVRQRHAELMSILPAPAESFTLYFAVGGSTLTAESEVALSNILAQAMARPGGEIVIIGHTDRVGAGDSNDDLSLQRARAVRELFIERGFPPLRAHAIGRGEREPAIPTADEIDEPRNRRVEIVVR